jgi:pyruvate,water dikinase
MDFAVANVADTFNRNGGNPHASEFEAALAAFLKQYGMRGPGEIDITRDRYAENTDMLSKIIAGNTHKEQSDHWEKHEDLKRKAQVAGERLASKAAQGWMGWLKAKIVRRLLLSFRTYMPFREYPKYTIMRIFAELKKHLLTIGAYLQAGGFIDKTADLSYLSLPEIQSLLESFESIPDNRRAKIQEAKIQKTRQLIKKRVKDYQHYNNLNPPIVMTSEGEIMRPKPVLQDLPPNAVAGSSVSAGIVEGFARVILDPTRETLKKGEILVTRFTDPGWTPLFISAAGLVMEVGGLMTHGSVIAREYGIPAVVGVVNATRYFKTGQKIRVNGDLGIIEIIE